MLDIIYITVNVLDWNKVTTRTCDIFLFANISQVLQKIKCDIRKENHLMSGLQTPIMTVSVFPSYSHYSVYDIKRIVSNL